MLIHAERCSGNRSVRSKAHPPDVSERRIPGGSLTCSRYCPSSNSGVSPAPLAVLEMASANVSRV